MGNNTDVNMQEVDHYFGQQLEKATGEHAQHLQSMMAPQGLIDQSTIDSAVTGAKQFCKSWHDSRAELVMLTKIPFIGKIAARILAGYDTADKFFISSACATIGASGTTTGSAKP
jgi:transposase